MKKLFLLSLIILVSMAVLNAQNVGVGTGTPNASAKLDISANNAGVLFPQINLASATDAATIVSPAKGLIVWNTASAWGDAAFYYNDGTSGSPVWTKVAAGAVLTTSLTNGRIWVGNASNLAAEQLVSGDGTISNTGILDLNNNAVETSEINDAAVTTIKIADNAVTGTKIDITSNSNGSLMFYNGTDWVNLPPGSSGQVLRTNGAGAPTWVNPGSLLTAGTGVTIATNTITNNGVVTASNGLTVTTNDVRLGGALTGATTISSLTATNKMSFTGTGVDAFNVDGTTFSVDALNDRVGIGTSSPDAKLTIVDDANNPLRIYEYNASDGANIRGYRARGTVASPTAVLANDGLTLLSGFGYTGSAFAGAKAQIVLLAAENWTSTANGTNITFATTPNAGTDMSERMRVTAAGNLELGPNNPAATAASNRIYFADPGNNIADPLSLHRQNVSSDVSDLRITIGDNNSLGNNDFLSVGTEGSTYTILNVRSDGNIGVGIRNAPQKFSVAGTLSISEANGGGNRLQISSTGTGADIFQNDNSPITFRTQTLVNSTTEKMKILDNGNVGIGNSSPNYKLEVAGDIRATSNLILNNTGPTVYLQDNNHRSGMIHMNSNLMHFLSADATNSLIWATNGSFWPLTINMANDVSTFGGQVHFMEGNVGLNTTTPGDLLDANGGVIRAQGFRCRSGINGSYGNVFNVNWTGASAALWIDQTNVGTFQFTSDRRLKSDISTVKSNAIDRVMQLRPVSFKYKNIEGTIFSGSENIVEGFIADELQQIIPSAVNGKKDAVTSNGAIQPQTLNNTPIISILTKAIQEQQLEIETLKAKNISLEKNVLALNTLKAELESLKSYIYQEAKK